MVEGREASAKNKKTNKTHIVYIEMKVHGN